jgi:flagellar assembly factor FliW
MEILTSRFGKISFSSKEVYEFSKGIYGFPEKKKFIWLKLKETEPFKWLQSIEAGNWAFLLIDPFLFYPDYDPQVSKKELGDIKLISLKRSEIYAIASLSPHTKEARANLVAPLIINPDKNLGKQVVLKGSNYRIHHPIFDLIEKKRHGQLS